MEKHFNVAGLAFIFMGMIFFHPNVLSSSNSGLSLWSALQAGRSLPHPVRVEATINDHRIARGKPFVLHIQLTIDGNFHINSNHPKDKFLIPTRIVLKNTPEFSFKEPKFPPAIDRKLEFSSEKLSVFEGEVFIDVPADSSIHASLGRKIIAGEVRYQACTQSTCYPPGNVPFETMVDVVQ